MRLLNTRGLHFVGEDESYSASLGMFYPSLVKLQVVFCEISGPGKAYALQSAKLVAHLTLL